MRKVTIEVKTIYDIRFNFHDFMKIFAKAKEDPTRIHAFDNFNLDDTTMGNIRECYKSLGKLSFFLTPEESKQQAENVRYIVRNLGFDGVENYGYLPKDDEREEYHMSVYNRGADI